MFNRVANQRRVQNTADLVLPAPTKGWVQSGNITIAPRDAAEVLDNFFPTAQSARLRGGCTVYADIGGPVVRMFSFSSTSDNLFAATADGIYNCDRIAGGGAAFADVAGLSSGDWSTTQMANAGGRTLVAVNGSDPMHYWNGTTWNPVNDAAVNDVPYDAMTAAFSVGETVTGSTSGATATIVSIVQTSATTGVLKVGAITGGPYQNNEALTSAGGTATANGASGAGSSVTLSNVSTSALSQVWSFKERLFFVEGNTLSAWYLPIESIGGAATEIDLTSIFRRGGSLLFGATWSLDSGSGLDDVCIFVTTNGEIAVYEGTDPSTADTWGLTGIYDIAAPIDKHSFFKTGGDLAVLTDDGIIPVSAALSKDRAALQALAITYPITDKWKEAVARRTAAFPISATLWQSQAMLLCGVPGTKIAYVANAQTGAWCRYTGWDVRCSVVSGNRLYFGTNDGEVRRAESGGSDAGASYQGIYIPKFTDAGVPEIKSAMHAGLLVRASLEPMFAMRAFRDYEIGEGPQPAQLAVEGEASWGGGDTWGGGAVWGGNVSSQTYMRWKSVRATGNTLSVGVYVTSGESTQATFEILALYMRFERGRLL